jgi:hypothetical protein
VAIAASEMVRAMNTALADFTAAERLVLNFSD